MIFWRLTLFLHLLEEQEFVGYKFKKQFVCGETTSRFHCHDLPQISCDDARLLKVVPSLLSPGESFYYMGNVCETQITENGGATLRFNLVSDNFEMYTEQYRIMATLQALQTFVGEKSESIVINTGTLNCQFTGGGHLQH